MLGLALAAGAVSADQWVLLPSRALAAEQSTTAAGLLVALTTASIGGGAVAAPALLRLSGSLRATSVGPVALLGWSMAAAAVGAAVLALGPGQLGEVTGVLMVGLGLGLYWSGAQGVLARLVGTPRSAARYVAHYAAYTVGTVVGALAGAGLAGLARHAGWSDGGSARAGLLLGSLLALTGWACWRKARARLQAATAGSEPPRSDRSARLGLSVVLRAQGPDLALVGALAAVVTLAPLDLATRFAAGPFALALFGALVGLAKAGGSLVAGPFARHLGRPRLLSANLALAAVLGAGAAWAGSLAVSAAALIGFAFLASGAWPMVVETSLGLSPPRLRHALAMSWSAREYPVMAVVLAPAGWLLGQAGWARLPELAGAAMVLASSAALRRRTQPAPDSDSHVGRSSTSMGACALPEHT